MKLDQIIAKTITDNIIDDITIIDGTPRNKRIRYFEFQLDATDTENTEYVFYLYGEVIVDNNDDFIVRISKGDESKKSFKYNHTLHVLENELNLSYNFIISNIHRTVRLCASKVEIHETLDFENYEISNLSKWNVY